MEPKIIIQALKCCHNLDECDDCGYNELGEFCDELLKRDAAERLEELDAELEKRTINDRPYEWISVEDRLPEKDGYYLVANDDDRAHFTTFAAGNFISCGVTHWMPLPEPPKPKEPTFKDVFLSKFPKAAIECDTFHPCFVFPWITTTLCNEVVKCSECWTQPYFEEEGGEE